MNHLKYALGMKCRHPTIWNETDKVVYVYVTDSTIKIGTTPFNIGGNTPGSAGVTYTNQRNMGSTPPQITPILPHDSETFILESKYYYLSYYTETKIIENGKEVTYLGFHKMNIFRRGNDDYKIYPIYLQSFVERVTAEVVSKETVLGLLNNHNCSEAQGKDGRKQGTSQNVGGTEPSSTAGPGQSEGGDTDSVSFVKYFSPRKFGNETIRNETDKVVYAIITDMSPETTPQMRLIDAHKCHTFNLSSSDYYLTYYTKDIASGRNVFHEVNVKLPGKSDYVILPEYIENHLDTSKEDPRISSLETEYYTKMDTTTPPVAQYQFVNQGVGGPSPNQGTSQNVGGTGSSSTAGPGQGSQNQGGQNQGNGGGKKPARDRPFINRIKHFLGKKCQSTIYNKTDKFVYVIVTDRIIGTTTTNTTSMNPTVAGTTPGGVEFEVGGLGLDRAAEDRMGPTPSQMRPIGPHKNRTFYLDSSDYYLSYYTKDIASGRNAFHEVNVKVPGRYDYEILPEYLEVEVELAPLLADEITRLILR